MSHKVIAQRALPASGGKDALKVKNTNKDGLILMRLIFRDSSRG